MKVLSRIVFIVTFSVSAALAAQSGESEIATVQGLIATGELDKALEVADVYIADNPKDPRMRFLKGLILTTKAEWQEAINVFGALSNDFPELPAPLNNLAVAYAEVGKYDLALGALKEAIKINPGYASAHENLGDIYVTLAALSYQQATSHEDKQQTAGAKLKVLGQLIPGLADAPASPQIASETESEPHTASIVLQPAAGPLQSEEVDISDEIETLVKAWASAWSSQDVDKYLGFYSDNFEPAGGKSLSQWRSERRRRLTQPAYIRVEIQDVEARVLTANQAQAVITQRYESNTYRDTASKELLLERHGNQWKIVQELARRE